MAIKKLVKDALTKRQETKYNSELLKRQVTYESWIRAREEKRSLTADTGYRERTELVYLCCSKGHPDKAFEAVFENFFNEHQKTLIAYCDEDVQGEVRREPWFKPAWSPDTLDCGFYFGSLVAVKKSAWDSCALEPWMRKELFETDRCNERLLHVKNYNDKETFSTYRILVQRLVEACGGYNVRSAWQEGADDIPVAHISEMLFHCDDGIETVKFLPEEKPDISDTGMSDEIRKLLTRERRGSMPFVTVVIPSKDNPELLEKCIKSLKSTLNADMLCEIIVVDNGSSADNRKFIKKLLQNEQSGRVLTEYIYEEREFNFSYMCNLGASHAKGEFLLFLNDDVELCIKDTVLVMAALASREYTGAVGIKLYYPGTVMIQHAGITNLPMGPVHKLQFKEDNICYYHGINHGRRNVSAVTGACLMVEKKKFMEISGFPEQLDIAFNDVDLCFGLLERGYYNVCLNDVYAYHHESLSRGTDESDTKLNRLLTERDTLYDRHPKLDGIDIYYPEGLGRDGLDTGVRPEYETAGNDVTKGIAEAGYSLASLRRDECLMVRVESCLDGVIHGYAVVLGDNNACYEKKLILADTENDDMVYSLTVTGQYRPDLVENMPDQINVGLGGFRVQPTVEAVGSRKYRVGVVAVNRVTGAGLYNFSNRIFEVNQSE